MVIPPLPLSGILAIQELSQGAKQPFREYLKEARANTQKLSDEIAKRDIRRSDLRQRAELSNQPASAPAPAEANQPRIQNIDNAFSLLNRVRDGLLGEAATGPITGSKLAATIRKNFGDQDLELLESFLNKEALETVKEVAAEAGARSIDTEGERAFLERTTPGIDKTPETIETLLLVSKSQLQKREFVAQNGEGSLEQLATFYNPQTFEITFAQPGQAPSGFQPLADRLTGRESSQGNTKPPGSNARSRGLSAAERFLNRRK